MQDSIALLCKDCKNTKDRLSYTKDDLTNLQNIKEDSKCHLNLTIEELQAQIKILKLEAQKHCLSLPCKALHYDTQSPLCPCHRLPSAHSSHPDSPMIEDQDDVTSHHCVVPQLLERLAITPTAALLTSSLQEIPPSLAEPSPSVGGDFTLCILDMPTLESPTYSLMPAACLHCHPFL